MCSIVRELKRITLCCCGHCHGAGLPGEVLCLRCIEGEWGQMVFKTAEDAIHPGWHSWRINSRRSTNPTAQQAEWEGELHCETRVGAP